MLPSRQLGHTSGTFTAYMTVNVRHPRSVGVCGATECCGRYERSSISSVSGAADARAERSAASS